MSPTQPATDPAALARIERSRTRLMAAAPWFGALSMHLGLSPSTAYPLMATDGTHLFYNPTAVLTASEPELIFTWAHEVLHCGLRHMFRKPQWCDWHEWNICTDHAINLELLRLALGSPPAGILRDPQYANLSAEQIAHLRRKLRQQQQPQPQPDQPDDDDDSQPDQPDSDTGESEDDDDSEDDDGQPDDADDDGQDADDDSDSDQPGDSDGQDDDSDGQPSDQPGTQPGQPTAQPGQGGQGGQPDPSNPDGTLQPSDDCLPPAQATADDSDSDQPPPRTETDWEMAVEQAMAVDKKAGRMPGGIERLIESNRPSRTDWRGLLRPFIEQQAPSDFTWRRPNRRYQASNLYLPSIAKENTPPILVAVDTSGSIGQAELDVFGQELTTILQESRPRAIHVVYCDTQINGPHETFTPDDGQVTLTARGGGGTLFQPVFDWLASAIDDGTLDEPPACLIYLTDGYAADLSDLSEPDTPTLFAITPGGTPDMPFGQVVSIDTW
jgi:predicted metal-dependent peptidase